MENDWKPISSAPYATLIEGRFRCGTVKMVEHKHGIWWFLVDGIDFAPCSTPVEWKYVDSA